MRLSTSQLAALHAVRAAGEPTELHHATARVLAQRGLIAAAAPKGWGLTDRGGRELAERDRSAYVEEIARQLTREQSVCKRRALGWLEVHATLGIAEWSYVRHALAAELVGAPAGPSGQLTPEDDERLRRLAETAFEGLALLDAARQGATAAGACVVVDYQVGTPRPDRVEGRRRAARELAARPDGALDLTTYRRRRGTAKAR